MITDMKIGTRMTLAFALVLLLLVGNGIFSITMIKSLSGEVNVLATDRVPKIEQAQLIINNVNIAARALRKLIIDTSKDTQAVELQRITDSREVINGSLATLQQEVKSEKGRRMLSEVVDACSEYTEKVDEYLGYVKSGLVEQAGRMLLTSVREVQKRYFAEVDQLIRYQMDMAQETAGAAEESAGRSRTITISLLIVAVLVSSVLGIVLIRSITGPVHQVVKLAETLIVACIGSAILIGFRWAGVVRNHGCFSLAARKIERYRFSWPAVFPVLAQHHLTRIGCTWMKRNSKRIILSLLVLLVVSAPVAFGAETPASPVFSQEELDQIVAPVALYPDALLSQILMASTYPLQVVEAQRWAEKNKTLQGDALTTALEQQNWDPSVKSLVNFPDVLTMMNDKLDWTQKLGDAVLAQQQDVMRTVQDLRRKAQEQGNLKTTEQQIVKVEKETIIIQPADPQVVYVPAYNPTVVYGTWPYPSYPPYSYYPPWYATATPYAFGAGLVMGAAWGYAWGNCDWHGGDIDIDVNRNANINRNINRERYAQQYGQRGQLDGSRKGTWQHNPQNRKGVPYRDQATAQRYNRGGSADAVKSREAFRGRAEQGRRDISRGAADRYKGQGASRQPARAQTRDLGSARSTGSRDLSSRSGAGQTQRSQGVSQRSGTTKSARTGTTSTRRQSSAVGSRGSAFQGMDSGKSARTYSSRGQSSRSSMSRPSAGGGRSGAGRSGGGGGGGRRR